MRGTVCSTRRGRATGTLTAALAAMAMAACGGGGGGGGIEPFESAGGVVAVDLDGDGRLDLAAAVSTIGGPPPHPGEVKVWLQRPDLPGTFAGPTRYAVGPDPWTLVTADLDADGRPDLVAMSAHASADPQTPLVDTVVVLRGLGQGRFAETARLHAGVRLSDLVAADFDGDGRPDLVFSGVGAAPGLWWNEGGTADGFSAPVILAGGSGGALATGDLDADGRADPLVVVGDELRWWARDPASPRGFVPARVVARASLPTCVAAADLDGDGGVDLVLCSRERADVGAPGDLRVWRRQAGGVFAETQRVPLPVHAWQCTTADVDGDGQPDLAAVGAAWGGLFDDMVAVARGDPQLPGHLLDPRLTATPGTAGGHHLALGDLDGDGHVDAAMPSGGSLLLLWADALVPGQFRRGPLLPP